jgi:hypothetical protein
MMAEQRAVAVGIFHDRAQVNDAVGALKDAGFAEEDIVWLSSPSQPSTNSLDVPETAVATASASESPGGGIGAGALENRLGHVAVGAGPGVVVAGLRGYGIAEAEAQRFEEAARQGAQLIAVHVRGRYEAAEDCLRRAGAFTTAETPAAITSALLDDDSAPTASEP